MTVKRIDYQRCTACSYPIDIGLNTFVIDLEASIVGKQESSPCQTGCPADANIPAFIYLFKQGRLEQAIELLREAQILPAITGYVCFHPCEVECARKEVDEAVNIKAIERFLAERSLEEKARSAPGIYGEKVAIVGSGPAGLAAAYRLAVTGYPVTIFESMSAPGGMLRYGIPEYRLPRNVLEAQINYIRDMGVEFHTGVTIGKDLTIGDLKGKGYRAIVLAIGAQKSLSLNIPGEGLQGVYRGLNFLREVNTGRKIGLGEKVVVVGGGNVAIDAARAALRLGVREVLLLYRRSREEMPAHDEEVREAEAEGVKISYLTAPIRIVGKAGRVERVECVRTELGKPDTSGRRSAIPTTGSEFAIKADTIITAIGEAPDLDFLAEEKNLRLSNGTLKVDRSLATAVPGVFACGDAVNGPSSVVEAIASGKAAAVSVDRYLKGGDLKVRRKATLRKAKEHPKEGVEKKPRQATPLLSIEERRANFKEVKLGFSEEMAARETERCMICGVRGNCTEVCPMDVLRMDDFLHKPVIRYPEDCMTCYNCEVTCPMGAIEVDPIKREMPLIIEYSSGAKKND